MKRGGVKITAAFLSGIFVSEMFMRPGGWLGIHIFENHLFYFLIPTVFLFAAAILSLHFLWRSYLKPSRFNLYFSSCVIALFFLLGAERFSVFNGVISPFSNSYISGQPQNVSSPEKTIEKIKDFSIKARTKAETKLRTYIIDKEDYAVMSAFTLGDKTEIPKTLKDSYRNAGVMHTLALSGLHVGIIWTIITTLLFAFKINYRGKLAGLSITIIIIILYSIITGFSPSVQRAGIMLTVWRVSDITFRQTDKWNILCISALIICLIDPSALFKAGFQLSFAAVAGIALIYPVINESFKQIIGMGIKPKEDSADETGEDEDPEIKAKKRAEREAQYTPRARSIKKIKGCIIFICSLIGISLSCQITTLPLTLYYFGSVPEHFLLANVAVIPLVTIVLYLLVAAIITYPFPLIGAAITTAARFSIGLLNAIVMFLGT
jgi:competence protein ComEC